MRNRMVNDGLLADGIAPSYFIEGLLYNATNDLFGGTFQQAFFATQRHVYQADRTQFRCPNGIHALLGDTQVTWPAANCAARRCPGDRGRKRRAARRPS